MCCLNIRSAVNKAALIHDVIKDNNIDIITLQETWMYANHPSAILDDIAPDGFDVLHVQREIVPGGPSRGGGLAMIFHESIASLVTSPFQSQLPDNV